MKIVIDLTSLADNFSGIERYALSITKELINDKNHYFILIFKNSIHKEFDQNFSNVDKKIIKGKNKLFFNQITLPLNIRRIKADVYLFLAFPAPFFFSGKKTISAIHDIGCWDCPESNKKIMIAYFRFLYRKASVGNKRIITVSEFSKQRIINVLSVDPQNILVAYDGLSDTFKDFKYDARQNEIVRSKYNLPLKYILCLSTIEPRKNLQLLIRAYTELIKDKKIDMDLVLAGRKGWLVENLLKDVPDSIKQHIVFTGFMEEEHLPYIYKNAFCFVFPSLYEGFGIPLIEAMSMRLLVLTSNAASMPEICEDASLYFQNNNIDSLKAEIIYLENISAEKKKEMIDKGLKRAYQFSWKVEAQKIISFINC